MIRLRLLPLLLFLLVVAGCSSSQRATVPAEPAPAPESEVAEEPAPPAEEPPAEEPDASGLAPADWFHQDAQDDTFPGISVQKTYTTLLSDKEPKRTVIVAVLDSGVDIEHEDLRANIWTNDDEVPGNDIDDDDNGYVDDVHGWNFIGGPEGGQVEYDTFESTRELARLHPIFEDVDPSTLTAEERTEYAYYLEVRDAYEQSLQEMEMALANISNALEAVRISNQILTNYFGTSTFTEEEVATIQTDRQDLEQAQNIFLYLASLGVDEAQLVRQKEQIEGRIEYGLNPEYDPRPIVGDDYANPTERIYGNNAVAGPDPFHGTHVAGIIGAVRDNDIGIDGIAPAVEIMVVRTVPNGDERDKDVANAIRYAVDNGADIINMSFGKDFSPQKDVVDEAVRYAVEQDVLLVHGAGNDGANIDTTANYPSRYLNTGDEATTWLEVGASSWAGPEELAASFSNYGKDVVDLFAPGVSIYSTVPDQQYDRADGTSMAAPVVSGVAALLMAYYPDLTAEEVRDILLESATPFAGQQVVQPGTQDTPIDFGALSRTGSIVNAYAAFQMAEERAN